jgi:hypothetical protein
LGSCNKYECESKTTTIDLEPAALSKVTYTGYDTLFFLNSQGDTCILRGTGKQYYYKTVPLTDNNPQCEPNYEKSQAYNIDFIPILGEFSFTLTLEDKDDVIINVKKYPYQYTFLTYEIGVESESSTLYMDTVTINGTLYRTIRLARISRKNNPLDSSPNYSAYYSKDFGIIKLENLDLNEVYTIILK